MHSNWNHAFNRVLEFSNLRYRYPKKKFNKNCKKNQNYCNPEYIFATVTRIYFSILKN